MHKTFLLATTLTLLAGPVLAQSALERLETATIAASANMEAFLTARAPELAAVMPDWTWDDEMRTAATCTLDAIRTEGGEQAVTAYLDEMEAFATIEITSLEQMSTATPVPVNTDFAVQTGQACGTAQISLRRMQESGFMEAMMDPETMGRLMQ